MGYHVTILRSAQGRQLPISLDEAKAAAGALGWTFEDIDGPAFVREDGEDKGVLWYQHEELWTKNPDGWMIAEMIALARSLDARVRGDENETYVTVDETYIHPDDVVLLEAAERESRSGSTKSAREQRLIRMLIVGFFVVLGAIAFVIGRSFEKH